LREPYDQMAAFVVTDKKCGYVDYNKNPNVSTSQKAIIMSPGLGDLKEEYRFIGPKFAAEYPEYRTIAMDLRGLGESDVGFGSYNSDDIARDIIGLIKHLNLTEVLLVGCSTSGGAMVYVAAESITKPEETGFTVKGIVLLAPMVWEHPLSPLVPCILYMFMTECCGPSFWTTHYRKLYSPKKQVADLNEYIANLKSNLRQPGRIRALYSLALGSKAAVVGRIADLSPDFPILAVYGTKDPDFRDLKKELNDLKTKMPQITDKDILIIEDGGHYPQVDAVEEVFARCIQFLTPLVG
jgi:pimeloyl-ACP methyl ester carboxylesterase